MPALLLYHFLDTFGAKMKVWSSEPAHAIYPRFHKDRDCSRARSSLRMREVELSDLERPEPCQICYPDAPKTPQLWKPFCPLCNKKRVYPCPHNGGVKVRVPYKPKTTRSRGGSLRGYVVKYVWPERARFYELIDG